MDLYVGIDTGKNGAIVALNKKKKLIYKYTIPKIKNVVDLRKLNGYFKEFSKHNSFISIENVHAIFGTSAKSTFSFGQIFGMLEGITIAHNFRYSLINPKDWQKEMFKGIREIRKPSTTNKNGKIIKGGMDNKAMAEIAYKRLFPGIDLYITEKGNKSKNVHDGLVDALLISEWSRRLGL